MNARAACRLESLGFTDVYRYAPGKADWRAAGLPMEGTQPIDRQAVDASRRQVPSCGLEETVGVARQRAEAAAASYCLVLSESRVVLGRVRGDAFDADPDRPISEVMEDGPTTTRADDDLADLCARMRSAQVATIIVTDPDGRLIGVLHRDDAEDRLAPTS